MARITRRELKSDKFALEVEHTVSFFEEHRKEIVRYGTIAAAVAALVLAFLAYQRHQRTGREQALARAIQLQEAAVGPSNPNGGLSFPTEQAKDQATTKAFAELAVKYSGSSEGEIAQYYLGAIQADEGKFAEAERAFQDVIKNADANYASLAKLSLAQVYFAQGRDSQAEALLNDLIAHPTIFVSKDQATVELAHGVMAKNPAEARRLLDPLKTRGGPVGQMVLTLWSQLPPQ